MYKEEAAAQSMAIIARSLARPTVIEGEETADDGARLVHFFAEPEEPSDQGFDRIGLASRIFSRFYGADTSAGDQVAQLHGEPRPEWFKPLSEWDFKASKLALRIFCMQTPQGGHFAAMEVPDFFVADLQ